jgi:hippurate hydrolase
MKTWLVTGLGILIAAGALAQSNALRDVDPLYPELEKLYLDLHANPELSFQEVHTSAKIAENLRRLGYDVTEKIGRTGVVGVLRNGKGPTIAIREDMDALPVPERTGLAFASHVTATDDSGEKVPVMHACGHDVHMTSLVGAATLLARWKDRWRGTLVLVSQPAEEKGSGALTMIRDGLFTRFPRPDFAIGLHDDAKQPAGKISWVAGYAGANVDSVDVTIFGHGGHGAYPQTTVDPVVIAAETVVALQTLVSRENNPFDPAVITVGSIHAGTKHNIIPDEAKLQLTVRSYKEDVRKKLLAGIERIAKAEAEAAGAPRPPRVEVTEGTPALYNDPALTQRIVGVFERTFGKENVVPDTPVMGGEDFSEFGRAGIPVLQYNLGAVEPEKWAAAQKTRAPLPSLHSSEWAPNRPITLRWGVASLTVAAMELLGKP